jgi:hypothetical protein
LPALTTLLRERRLSLLLDALNEIPHRGDEPVRLWKAFLQTLDRDYPGNRVVFSCRSLDDSASLSSRELTVPQVRIDCDDALEIVDHERARDIVDAGIALGVLDEDLGREELLYVHQLLQEYFAAHRLAATPEATLVQVEWRADRVSPSLQEPWQV